MIACWWDEAVLVPEQQVVAHCHSSLNLWRAQGHSVVAAQANLLVAAVPLALEGV